MKNIISLSVLVLVTISFSFGQGKMKVSHEKHINNDSIRKSTVRKNDSIRIYNYYTKFNPSWLKHTPGYELQLYSRNYYTGLVISTIGSLILINGIKTADVSNKSLITNTGIVFGLVGTFFMVKSGIHIKRAGIIMDRNGVGLSIPIGK